MNGIWALKPYYLGPWTLTVSNGASKGAYLQGYVRISTLLKGPDGQIKVQRVSGTKSHSPES